MAENTTTASIEIHLEDEVSGSAKTAAQQLTKLRDAIQADTKAIAALQKSMQRLKAGGLQDGAAYQALNAKLKEHRAQLAGAQQKYLELGGGLLSTNKPARDFNSLLSHWQSQLGSLPGPLSEVSNHLGTLGKLFSGGRLMALGIAAAIVAVAFAVVKLTKSLVDATIQLTKYGIAQREARRNESLRLEALTKMRSMHAMTFGIKPGDAKQMQSAIDQVSASVSIGREDVEKYNAQLYRMGLRGAQLTAALQATATKASALGDEAAQGTMGWAAAINMTGGSVKRLADDVKARFGGIVAKQMLSSEVQARKLQESYGALFADLDIDPLLQAKATVNALFSQSTESGKALKSLLTTFLQPLVNSVKATQPIIKRFFQGLILGTLDVGIALLKVRNWFRRTFGDSELFKRIDATKVALDLGRKSVMALAGAFAVFAVVAVPVLTALGAVAFGVGRLIFGAFQLIGAALMGLIKTFNFITENWSTGWTLIKESLGKFWDYIKGIDWADLGTSIIKGILAGLVPGGDMIADAVSSIAKSAWGAFQDTLGIHSPSKVFAELGAAIPQGVKQGVESAAPDAQAAASGMVEAPPASGGSGSGARGGSITIDVGGIVVNAESGDQAKQIAGSIRTELEQVFEQLALQLGAAIT